MVSDKHLRIVTYSDKSATNEKKALERRVPCFVCHERPDADALVESSVLLLHQRPVTFLWRPRSKIWWWNSNRKVNGGFNKSGDDVAKEALYNWLNGCPIVVKSLSELQGKALYYTLKFFRTDELWIEGFWLKKKKDGAELHMTLTGAIPVPYSNEVSSLIQGKIHVRTTGSLSVYKFDVLCGFEKKNCISKVPRSLLQRRYLSVTSRSVGFSIEDGRLRLTVLNRRTKKSLNVLFPKGSPNITSRIEYFISQAYRNY